MIAPTFLYFAHGSNMSARRLRARAPSATLVGPDIVIRPETPADIEAIERVTIAAFRHAPHTQHTEHLIVAGLRRHGQLSVSRVADDAGTIVGHVALSPVTISDGTRGWFGLGPLSVEPGRQRRGIGSCLVEHAMADLRAMGAAGCVLLGDPAYYARFGFRADASLRLEGVPPEYFQALAFGSAVPAGAVRYDVAFDVAPPSPRAAG